MNYLTQEVWPLFLSGGHLMWPLMGLSVVIYYTAFELFLYFYRNDLNYQNETRITQWLKQPDTCPHGLQYICRYVKEGVHTLLDLQQRFSEVRNVHIDLIDRRIRFLVIVTSVAPLMGLLGTVVGMLTTFRGISAAAGETVDLVARGISEALVTTQTGLMIAIPAYLFVGLIRKKRDELELMLTHMESLLSIELSQRGGGGQ